jgi:hypothetical protein
VKASDFIVLISPSAVSISPWLLHDEFDSGDFDDATSRTCNPGPGQLLSIQSAATQDNFSIVGGELKDDCLAISGNIA